jgi:L-fuculose-phosphate aldolase
MTDYSFDSFARDILGGLSSAAESVSDAASGAAASASRYKGMLEIGHDLYGSGSVTSHGGNLSLTDGKRIYITRTGARLGYMTPSDVVTAEWHPAESDSIASMELKVHRAMYQALAETLADQGVTLMNAAIVHAHNLHATCLSLLYDRIEPLDAEGIHVLGPSVPVLAPSEAIASDEVAQMMASLVRAGGSIAVVRSHGPFAIADTLANAHRQVSCLEYSAKLLTLHSQLRA